MEIEGTRLVFLLGCGGGVLAELLHWWSLRAAPEWPEYARSVKYWALTAAMILAGGGLCAISFPGKAPVLGVLQIGLSTPVLLQKLTTTVADTASRRTPSPAPAPAPAPASNAHASVLSFFRW